MASRLRVNLVAPDAARPGAERIKHEVDRVRRTDHRLQAVQLLLCAELHSAAPYVRTTWSARIPPRCSEGWRVRVELAKRWTPRPMPTTRKKNSRMTVSQYALRAGGLAGALSRPGILNECRQQTERMIHIFAYVVHITAAVLFVLSSLEIKR